MIAEPEAWALPGSVTEGEDGGPRLVGGACRQCGLKSFPRARICSRCWSEAVDAVALASEGTLYAHATVHAARKGWRAPYVIAYVDLDDGVRVCAPLDVANGSPLRLDTRVRLTTGPLRTEADGRTIFSHRFTPISMEA